MSYRKIDASGVLKSIDWPTVLIYLLMVIAGVISIYAASYDFDEAGMLDFSEFSGKQALWIALSFGLGFIILLIDSRMFETYAYPIYILILILLFITPFVAPDIKGSKSWIVLGPMSLQPAEFAKFATALALAKLFSGYNFVLTAKWSNLARAGLIICLPIILILLQKETGSALTFMALFFVLYREGISGLLLFGAVFAVVIFVVAIKFTETAIMGIPTGQFWILVGVMAVMVVMLFIYNKRFNVLRNVVGWFALSAAVMWVLTLCGVQVPGMVVMLSVIGIAAVYLAFEALKGHAYKLFVPALTPVIAITFMFSVNMAFDYLQPHQQLRIKVVLGIEEDLRGAGYNVNQSKIAIGSGGLLGKGFLNGTQTKLKYVPEQHTDFIFCTIGEEEGFWGAMIVLGLYVALILRVIVIAERQHSTFGRVYAYCVASYFIFHFCINIGMVIGLCPVIGIPLPFFSYGGTALSIQLAEMGIVLSVSRQMKPTKAR